MVKIATDATRELMAARASAARDEMIRQLTAAEIVVTHLPGVDADHPKFTVGFKGVAIEAAGWFQAEFLRAMEVRPPQR